MPNERTLPSADNPAVLRVLWRPLLPQGALRKTCAHPHARAPFRLLTLLVPLRPSVSPTVDVLSAREIVLTCSTQADSTEGIHCVDTCNLADPDPKVEPPPQSRNLKRTPSMLPQPRNHTLARITQFRLSAWDSRILETTPATSTLALIVSPYPMDL